MIRCRRNDRPAYLCLFESATAKAWAIVPVAFFEALFEMQNARSLWLAS